VPELPEVETLRRGLERMTLGRRISDVVVANAKVLKGQSPERFRERTTSATITGVRRRGKYLLIQLAHSETKAAAAAPADSPEVKTPLPTGGDTPPAAIPASPLLCIHLKMRGQLLLEEFGSEAGPYHCVTLSLDGNNAVAGSTVLRFYDMWTWGEMRALTEDELAEAAPGLAEMGPEPLEADWDGEVLRAALAGRRTAIKPTLLDQAVVAGVGNIYADESLFRAGIHPQRMAKSLSDVETERLARSIREVLTEAVEGGGTTSDEYVDLGGTVGRYTPRVYDRGGEPCPQCGTALTRIKLGGRGTVFCGSCQPPAV